MRKHKRNSWSVLPCAQVLWNQRTVSLHDLGAVWNDVTVYICEREARFDKKVVTFLVSCGPLSGVKVGQEHDAHHDQTLKHIGTYTVTNIVRVVNGEVASKSNDLHLDTRRAVSVFK